MSGGITGFLKSVFQSFQKALVRKPFQPRPPGVYYLGQKGSGIYHRDDCEYGMMMRHNFKRLRTQAQAIEEGFTPCKVCRPDRHPYTP
jgi:methylphosphotriester-DNA--protein-cysteine methyltransferase